MRKIESLSFQSHPLLVFLAVVVVHPQAIGFPGQIAGQITWALVLEQEVTLPDDFLKGWVDA